MRVMALTLFAVWPEASGSHTGKPAAASKPSLLLRLGRVGAYITTAQQYLVGPHGPGRQNQAGCVHPAISRWPLCHRLNSHGRAPVANSLILALKFAWGFPLKRLDYIPIQDTFVNNL